MKKGPAVGRQGLVFLASFLQLDYVSCLRAFLAISDFKLNAIAFCQRLEAVARDCREVYEYVRTAVLLNETKTFCVIEPLY